jgi:putative transposase
VGRPQREVVASLRRGAGDRGGVAARDQQHAVDVGEREGLSTPEPEELRKLLRVEQERNLLKRAAAFFARETEIRWASTGSSRREGRHPGFHVLQAAQRRSGFYDWAKRVPSDRALSDAWLLARIKAIHAANRGVYGAHRVHRELASLRASGSGASAGSA